MALTRHDDDLWSAEHEFGWQAGLVPIPVRMTVIRLRDGTLVLHSPIPISSQLRQEIDALGSVGFIVVPQQHGKFAGAVADAYPDARLLAAPRAPRQRRSLPFRGSLAEEPPEEWRGEVECRLVAGFRLGEVLLFHPSSRTLVMTDLCFNIHRSSSAIARAFFRANGMWQSFGPSRIIRRIGVSDRAAFRDSLDRLMEWNIARIVPGHGDVVENVDPAAIREAWLGSRG